MRPGDILPIPSGWPARSRTALAIVTGGSAGTRRLSDAARYALIERLGIRRRAQAAWLLRQCTGSPRSWPGSAPLALAAIFFGVAALPISLGPVVLWESDDEASDFLGLLWQVTAGTLGVAVAALIFLYESFGAVASRRRVLTLAEFARRSGVLNLVGWLVTSLLLTGSVLLGWGHNAPRGWAGILSLAVAVYALVALPRAFVAAANLVSPDRLQAIFVGSILPQVAEAVQRDVLTITMRDMLEKRVEASGAKLRTLGTPKGAVAHTIGESGLIVDVDLKEMRNALEPLTGAEVHIPLFFRARKGDATVWGDSVDGSRAAVFVETVKARRTGDRWDDFTLIKNLGLDGMEALSAQDSVALDSCLQLHEEVIQVLLAFDDSAVSVGLPSLESNTDLLHSVRHSLLRLHRSSVDTGNAWASRDVAKAAHSLMNSALDSGHNEVALQLISSLADMSIYEVKQT